MKTAFAIAAGALALTGAALADDDGIVSRKLDLAGFDRISVAGVYELDVRVGPGFSIMLSGPAYEMDKVEASVENGALVLSQRKWKKGEKKRHDRDGVEAVITMPSLTGVNISGVVEGHVSDIDAGSFDLTLSGVGDIAIDGECGEFKARVSGVGDLDARRLECRKTDIDVSGVGDASVFASDEIDVKISGMGDIDVYGSPEKVRKSKGMFSDITVH